MAVSAASVAVRSGGYVEIAPGADGEGTTVEIYLPRLKAKIESEKQAVGAEP